MPTDEAPSPSAAAFAADDGTRPARWWHALEDGRIQCDLCPRDCKLHPGQRGLCFVRAREGDAMVLTTHGRSSGFAIDPIEKKPLNHFYPGSAVLSFGTAGCNLACRFCQNWDISKSREMDRLQDRASPEAIARSARAAGALSVAFTYNDPVVFAEYAMDCADACRAQGIHSVAVTAGYMHAEPRAAFYAKMDAANVDLKAFSERFYAEQTASRLAPVLDTLQHIVHDSACWLEITTLLIPGLNDSPAELGAMCRWISGHLGNEVPLHFTAFHPDHKLRDRPPTPLATLHLACRIARDAGLRHVYTGNRPDPSGGITRCAQCATPLIVREAWTLRQYALRADGRCPQCHSPLAGRYAAGPGAPLGLRRQPMRIRPR